VRSRDFFTQPRTGDTQAKKMTPKPILKSQRTVKKKKQNHYVPGFVYIFHDPLAMRGEGMTMCKIGLSRTPKRRRYFLSDTYKSNLKIKAIAPTMNMRLTEILHKIFASHQRIRTRGLDGSTEWFQVNFFRIKQMQITLFAVAALVNLAYFVGRSFVLMFLSYLLFRWFLTCA
jgi:hypothetical protein